ncbi:MAG: arginine--tRNA ligase [bacterium TMED161]|nr:MAG: arginine--tRNA ligase [bacterium TMED161]|tara:strand:+ start:225 stop:1856 length:1632 start_codon:yes stop_codon:yes gene_type:complete
MKNKFQEVLLSALSEIGYPTEKVIVQSPKNPDHGDFTTNYPMINSKEIGKSPMEIASIIVDKINSSGNELIDKIDSIPPGFINVKINKDMLSNQLKQIILSDSDYGKNDTGKNKSALIEFVSANPTGPLTVGHGRNAILGDTVCNILEWNGFNINREYYFNNAGRQMRVLGESVYVRYMELLGENLEIPDGGYEGLYIKDIAKIIFDTHQEKFKGDSSNKIFKQTAEEYIFEDIEKTLKKIGLKFDSFFNENTLYDNNDIDRTVNDLKAKNLIYEKDGATWFKATAAGRDMDRVIIKSTGEPTYRLPDIAYHRDKFDRNFDVIVDVFGADHMDAYPDVIAAIKSLDYDSDKIKVLIHQFVTVLKNGEPVKMSTRKANFISLDSLIDEVGADVTRFFFIMRSMNTHLNFDLDLAKEQSDANPVFYIQYAHARCCNMLRRFEGDLDSIDESSLEHLKLDIETQLINKLLTFSEVIRKSSQTLEPQNISNYLAELSSSFHSYYAKERVIDSDNKILTEARIYLVNATRIVIRNGLKVLGVSAPEQM